MCCLITAGGLSRNGWPAITINDRTLTSYRLELARRSTVELVQPEKPAATNTKRQPATPNQSSNQGRPVSEMPKSAETESAFAGRSKEDLIKAWISSRTTAFTYISDEFSQHQQVRRLCF
jgi:hypothetical protein